MFPRLRAKHPFKPRLHPYRHHRQPEITDHAGNQGEHQRGGEDSGRLPPAPRPEPHRGPDDHETHQPPAAHRLQAHQPRPPGTVPLRLIGRRAVPLDDRIRSHLLRREGRVEPGCEGGTTRQQTQSRMLRRDGRAGVLTHPCPLGSIVRVVGNRPCIHDLKIRHTRPSRSEHKQLHLQRAVVDARQAQRIHGLGRGKGEHQRVQGLRPIERSFPSHTTCHEDPSLPHVGVDHRTG